MLEGKSVIITGAARGIGRATAEKCAREGANLTLVDLATEALQDTANLCRELGAVTHVLTQNVCEAGAGVFIADEAVKVFGGIDTLINNAGIEFRGSLDAHGLEDWNRVMDVNLTAAFALSKAASTHLTQSRGAIVNVASVAITGFAGQCAYDASKGGLPASPGP